VSLRSVLLLVLFFVQPRKEPALCWRDSTLSKTCYDHPVFSLIILLLFAIGFGYFATFNTLTVSITFGTFYEIAGVPLYIVIGASLLTGLLLSWLIMLVGSLSNHFTLRSQARQINTSKATIHAMTKKTNDLQIENANLKGELKNDPTDELTL
jgi:uncharacterized integral membrane protein